MKKSFTLSREDALVADPAVLAERISRETGSEAESASILRSLERMGTDRSILFFEMTLEARTSRTSTVASTAWRVRADRGRTDPPPIT